MKKLFSTGPVENAAANSALSVLVKVLNNSTKHTLTAQIKLFGLDGTKVQVSSVTLSVPPMSSNFSSFQVDSLNEYEVQIEVDRNETALISVWGLDSDANLIAAQRFVQTELKEIRTSSIKTNTYKIKLPGKKTTKKRR